MKPWVLLSIGAVAVTACHRVQPPAAPPPREAVEARVAAPFDTVWSRAVGFFASANVPIETIDRASGLLAARRFALGPDQRLAWMNCGTAAGKSLVQQANRIMRGTASLNVSVQPSGDSTRVRVNLAVEGERMNPFAGGQFTPDACVSTGALERDLLATLGQGTR